VSPRNKAALSELVNALQVAAPLATAVRQGLGDATDNAVKLEAAVHRAVKAVRRLQPTTKKEKS
jgi:thioesterase domain-containing protein